MAGRVPGIVRRGLKRVFRLLLGLLLIPLAAGTFLLFTTTSSAIPRAVRPWDEFGCVPWSLATIRKQSPQQYMGCISPCGRFYATAVRSTIGNFGREKAVRDLRTNEILCTIIGNDRLPFELRVSTDGGVVALRDFSQGITNWEMYRSGTRQKNSLERAEDLEISLNEAMVLLATQNEAVLEDLLDQRPKFSFQTKENSRIDGVFFDRECQPKALVSFPKVGIVGLELWDISKGQREWLNNELPSPPFWYILSRDVCVVEQWSQASFYSMADGRLIKRLQVHRQDNGGGFVQGKLSSDGRYYLYPHNKPGVLDPLRRVCSPDGWLTEQLNWLELSYPVLVPKSSWILEDVQTETSWLNIKGGLDACFRECDNCLTTYDDDGVYDWDLPPRQRWFTPWASLSLAATVALSWYLCPWSRRTRKASAEA